MGAKRYKKGYFTSVGLAIGIPAGIPIGLALGNIAVGPAIGLPLGLLLGSILEKRLNPNPIVLSKAEERRSKRLLWIMGIGGLLLLIILLEMYIRLA